LKTLPANTTFSLPAPTKFGIRSDVLQMLLTFVPSEKKIAYAAGIGNPVIPDNFKETFRLGRQADTRRKNFHGRRGNDD